MSEAMSHYVCDTCANQWDAHRASGCPACRGQAIWEFSPDRKREANDHAAHIARGNQSAIFKRSV